MKLRGLDFKFKRISSKGVIPFLGAISFLISACGDGSSNPTSPSVSANSVTSIAGNWTLKSVADQNISDANSAVLSVASGSDQALTQPDCSGSVKATFNADSKLILASQNTSGCFVTFPISVEKNRDAIKETLKDGSDFLLNSDSTLTLQGPTGKLVFVPSK
ncbi:MAG: hypothetical protein JWQ35_1918 [Bacteriovoracaceae bacterium]|nr:hypothetical protein [Bacteriovoracaceae bacterium]